MIHNICIKEGKPVVEINKVCILSFKTDIQMAKRVELRKNVKSTPLQDVKNSTDACLKADNVRMDVIKRNFTDEMSEKPERNKEKTDEMSEKPERNKEKTEEDTQN